MNAKALPQHIIDKMDARDRKDLGVKSTRERVDTVTAKCEADLQRQVEAFCTQLGFEKLTEDNIRLAAERSDFPRRGWQYHLSQKGAKKNPMLPDVTLFDVRGDRYLWLELKVPGGKVRPLQQVMIDAGVWQVAFTAEEAAGIINGFVSRCENGVAR